MEDAEMYTAVYLEFIAEEIVLKFINNYKLVYYDKKIVLFNGREGIWKGFTSIPSFDILKAFPRSMDFVRRYFQKIIWSN